MMRIKKTETRRQDLGLLMVLDALLAEGSVTGAARRLHLSQPAVSSALQRLREWVGDPLLVRGGGGYTLTARAQELIGPVRRILEEIDQTVRLPAAFDPALSDRTFRIATNDAFQLAVLPGLLARLRRDAPGATLEVAPSGPEVDVKALQGGLLDLCTGHYAAIPAGVRSCILMQEHLVGLARHGHPLIRTSRPSLRQWAAATHVAIAPQGHTFIAQAQAALASAGLEPRIGLVLPHVLAAPFAVVGSDLVATVPQRLALAYAGPLGLRVFDPPVAFRPFDVYAAWHERAHRDAGLTWLRELLREVCGELPKPAAARRAVAQALRT